MGLTPTSHSAAAPSADVLAPEVVRGILAKMVEDNRRRQRDGFSISQLGNCAAQQLFSIAGFDGNENPPSARTLLTWRSGNMHEDEIVWILEVLGGQVIIGKQKEFIGAEPPREGHIDGLWLLNNKLYTFDAKSANVRSFEEWLTAAGQSKYGVMKDGIGFYTPFDKPGVDYRPVRHQYESYYMQAQGYLELINSRPEYSAYRIDNMADPPAELAAAAVDGAVPIATDGFFFVVYCKDNSSLYIEFVPYDEHIIRGRLDTLKAGFDAVKFAREHEATDEQLATIVREYKEVPLNDNGDLHWKCKRCPFVATCWG